MAFVAKVPEVISDFDGTTTPWSDYPADHVLAAPRVTGPEGGSMDVLRGGSCAEFSVQPGNRA